MQVIIIKNCEGSEILSNLQTSRLACHDFINGGGKPKILYSVKVFFKNKGKIKVFSDEPPPKKEKEKIISKRPTLKEILTHSWGRIEMWSQFHEDWVKMQGKRPLEKK